MMIRDQRYFTLVFEGDIMKLDKNPHKIETPFGFAIASGIGNAFDVIEHIHEVHEAAIKLVEIIDSALIPRDRK